MPLALPTISPNERPIYYPGESPRTLSGRLKSYTPAALQTLEVRRPDPEPPLEPPDEKGVPCEACDGAGCEDCDFTGTVFPEPQEKEYEPEEEHDPFF